MEPGKFTRCQLILFAVILCVSTTPFFQNTYPFEVALRETGTFSDLCAVGEDDCSLRQAAFSGLFITATCAGAFSAAIGGIILDQWGPKLAALSGFVIEIGGFLLLSMYPLNSDLLFVALPIISGGAYFSFYGFIPIAELFPRQRNFIIGVMGAFRSLGLVNAFIVAYLVRKGFLLWKLALWMGLLISVICILVWIMLPEDFASDLLTKSPLARPLRHPRQHNLEGFIQSAVSKKFWPFVYLICVFHLICTWFDSTVYLTAPKVADVYSIILPFTCFLSPILGYFMDNLGAFSIHNFLIFIASTFQLYRMLPSTWVQSGYTLLVFVSVIRVYLESQWISFVGGAFPAKYEGRLIGVAYMAMGFSSLFLTPLWDMYRSIGGLRYINGALLIVSLSTFGANYILRETHRECGLDSETECVLRPDSAPSVPE